MSSKTYCFGARSTERFIQEPGQCAVIKQRLFRTESAAREYFRGEGSEYEIVRVTLESIESCSELETKVDETSEHKAHPEGEVCDICEPLVMKLMRRPVRFYFDMGVRKHLGCGGFVVEKDGELVCCKCIDVSEKTTLNRGVNHDL